MRAWLEARWRAIREAVGVRELHVYGGLALLAYGLSGWDLRVAMSTLGVMLVYMGLFHRR